MAYSHHATDRQPRRQRHTSPSRSHDWEPRPDSVHHSLPYRARHQEVQRPDDRKPKHSSHRRSRHSDYLSDRRSMPHSSRHLTRSSTVAHRSGKGRSDLMVHGEDSDEEEERLRTRLGSRSRSASLSQSQSRTSQSFSVATPTRSVYLQRSARSSAHSSRSSSPDPTPESDSESGSEADFETGSASSSSASSRGERCQRRALKRRLDVPPQVPQVPDLIQAQAEHRHSRRKQKEKVIRLEESSPETEDEEVARVEVTPSTPRRRRPRNLSKSRSPSRRRHRHRHHYDEMRPGVSSKRNRRPHKKYYTSDVAYSEQPSLSRSYTTSSSHVNSSQTMSSSSRRSSSFLGAFFPPTVYTHRPHERDEKAVKMSECVACLDDVPSTKAPKLKCGHRMCTSCLKRTFRLSVKDPQQMPPKCCSADCIPLKHVSRLFDDNFKRNWNKKFAEYSTRNRIYCPAKRCGEWIKPGQIYLHQNGRKVGKCSRCRLKVCCKCNNRWHDSRHCPKDEETRQILKQAKEEGWQRCFNCRNVVELKEGCNHMTCRCGGEFCMICGMKWKSCDCPWFNYNTVEQDRLDHMPPGPLLDRGRRTGTDARPGARARPKTYGEEILARRLQQGRDEDYARRLQYDEDDNYVGRLGDVVGLGNSAGHFMNDDYRRGPQNMIPPMSAAAPAPPPPPAPPVAPFERTNSGTDYVSGVNRARGLRAGSMERRLADRFSEQRQGSSPSHRPFGQPLPPPPMAPLSMGPPPPPPAPPGVPASLARRHTMDEDVYESPRSARLAERMTPRRTATRDYASEAQVHAPRRHHREPPPPKDSVLAGLTGQGRGMNRVFEWRNHVDPGAPPGPIST
ncbi:hypothetical protein F5Y15DRAFT_15167 [Xylariaceae sp. FL0016]|nr:hypothetical protein F5Y15DRAFT_15167 [Xylariaceae sp. FL0016]